MRVRERKILKAEEMLKSKCSPSGLFKGLACLSLTRLTPWLLRHMGWSRGIECRSSADRKPTFVRDIKEVLIREKHLDFMTCPNIA